MNKVYQTTAGENMLYIVVSHIVRIKTGENESDKKYPYWLNICYSDKCSDCISYKVKKDRDQVVNELIDLIEKGCVEETPNPSQALEQKLKDYDPMEALR